MSLFFQDIPGRGVRGWLSRACPFLQALPQSHQHSCLLNLAGCSARLGVGAVPEFKGTATAAEGKVTACFEPCRLLGLFLTSA